MKYNRSEIMKAAWASYRESRAYLDQATRRWPKAQREAKLAACTFASALKLAWANAKYQAQNPVTKKDLEERLFLIKMIDRPTPEDDRLARELERRIAELAA